MATGGGAGVGGTDSAVELLAAVVEMLREQVWRMTIPLVVFFGKRLISRRGLVS